MTYKEFKPNSFLLPYFNRYWSVNYTSLPFSKQVQLLPDDGIQIIFFLDTESDESRQKVNDDCRGVKIIGMRRKRMRITLPDKASIFGISLNLNAGNPFLKAPLLPLVNEIKPAEDLFGIEFERLEGLLKDAPDTRNGIDTIEKYILLHTPEIINNDVMVTKAISMMLADPRVYVATILEELNTNYKTLERYFQRELGITPSEMIKILRFKRALAAIRSKKYRTLTEIGYHCGYYDQPHFTNEFKELAGFTPKDFLKIEFRNANLHELALGYFLTLSSEQ